MEEGGKVRVVRCPKCQKLLPELPDIPVYRCGGCNAALQAKSQTPSRTESPSEKSDEGGSKSCGDVLNDACEIGRENKGMENMGKDSVFLQNTSMNSSHSPIDKGVNMEVLDNYSDLGRYRCHSKAPTENYSNADNPDLDELIMKRHMREGVEANAPIENENRFQKSRQLPLPLPVRDATLAFHKARRAAIEGSRYCPYPDEGPSSSNHHVYSGYQNGEQGNNQNLDVSDRVGTLEKDRVGLLRKLDELRDQLSRSCDVSEQPNEKNPSNRRIFPPDAYDGSEAWFPEGPAYGKRGPSQLYPVENPVRRPLYFDQERHGPLIGGHDMDMQNCYPPRHGLHEISAHKEPFAPQLPIRAPNQLLNQYPQRPSNGYLSGSHYVETDPDPTVSYPPHGFYEQPPCSCLHCYNRQWQFGPSAFCNQRLPSATNSHTFYHHVDNNPNSFGLRPFNHRGGHAPPLHSCEAQPHLRKPSDLEFDTGAFRSRSQPQRSMLVKGNRQSCLPIADGAPFIICCNCSELLQLPQKLLLSDREQFKVAGRNQCKLRCGACSNVISFTYDGKRLVFPFSSQTKDLGLDYDNNSSGSFKEGLPVGGYQGIGTVSSSSDGYESSNCNVQSADGKRISMQAFDTNSDNRMGKESMLNLSESEKRQGLTPSSVSSEDEDYPESMIAHRDLSNSTDHHGDASPKAVSPTHENFGASPTNQIVGKFEKGSRSKRSDHEKNLSSNSANRQNSVKDASVATEMDCSYNDYTNSGVSQDSMEANKEEDQHKFSKGSESFFAGLIKKSFKDFGRSSDQSSISVNGHIIPVRLVRRAERKAGDIQPGQYWYDYRAGFWGVMGHQCLGIIPPFIEELNYPMPKNCSGGDTGVFVNSRELHQKDLDLLASRGLPTIRDKSYIVEISGRVFDEATGEELEGLGKLAPTVERVRHGFGMRVPRSMA